jgi:WD40 repeat protein
VKIWDIETQRELKTLPGQRDAYFDLVLSPDGRRLAGAGGDMTVKLWDTKTYQEVATLRGNPQHNIFERPAFSPDGNALIAGSSKAIYRWRAPSLSEIDAKEAKEKSEGQAQ